MTEGREDKADAGGDGPVGLDNVCIGWQVGSPSGWGVYGLNLAVQAARLGVQPDFLVVTADPPLTPLQIRLLEPAFRRYPALRAALKAEQAIAYRGPVIHGLADDLTQAPALRRVKGSVEIGAVFFENGLLPEKNLPWVRDLPLMVAGSSWNAEVMRRHGLDNVALCLQGVDRDLFHPAPSGRGAGDRLFPGRFLVFSGGKMEYRKGQDLVAAAFKVFHQRHPDALLVTAWHNLWPEAVKTIGQSPHVEGVPEIAADRRLEVREWLARNGIPPEAVIDLGVMRNHQMPQVLRQCDVGLFPSRCEGGTNLVAMEAMACGLPVILSNNTGHRDLIHGDGEVARCWSLDMQLPLADLTGRPERVDWGESLIDEMVAKLEAAHADRAEAARRGAAAARFMEGWDWSLRVADLLREVARVA